MYPPAGPTRRRYRDEMSGEEFEMDWNSPDPPSEQDIDLHRRQKREQENSWSQWGMNKISDAWKWANTPVTKAPSNYMKSAIAAAPDEALMGANINEATGTSLGNYTAAGTGFAKGAAQAGADIASEMTTPLNMGLTALSGGAWGAGRLGYAALARGLAGAESVAGAAQTGLGTYKAATGDTWAERAAGAGEALFGYLGYRGGRNQLADLAKPKIGSPMNPEVLPPLSPPAPEVNPARMLPDVGATQAPAPVNFPERVVTPPAPPPHPDPARFVAGPGGVADTTIPGGYTRDMSTGVGDPYGPNAQNMTWGAGQVGDVAPIDPMTAANVGLGPTTAPVDPNIARKAAAVEAIKAEPTIDPLTGDPITFGTRGKTLPQLMGEAEDLDIDWMEFETPEALDEAITAKLSTSEAAPQIDPKTPSAAVLAAEAPPAQAVPDIEAPPGMATTPEVLPDVESPVPTAPRAPARELPKSVEARRAAVSDELGALDTETILTLRDDKKMLPEVAKRAGLSQKAVREEIDKLLTEPTATAPDMAPPAAVPDVAPPTPVEELGDVLDPNAPVREAPPTLPEGQAPAPRFKRKKVPKGGEAVQPEGPPTIEEQLQATLAAGSKSKPKKGVKEVAKELVTSEEGSFDPAALSKNISEATDVAARKLRITETVPEDAVPTFHEWMGKRAAGEVKGTVKARELEGITDFNDPKVQKYLDEASARGVSLDEELALKEHYFPSLFEESGEVVHKTMGGKTGPERFSLKAIREAIAAGEAKGLTPKHKTPSELAEWYEHALDKADADRTFFNRMREQGHIKPSTEADFGWEELNMDLFPSFAKQGSPGARWKVSKDTKRAIENYVIDPDDTVSMIAKGTQVSKNIALSSGVIPGTAINAHGVNLLARNVHARTGRGEGVIKGIVKGSLEGIGMMINTGADNPVARGIEKVAPWQSARAQLEPLLDQADEFVKEGLTLSTEGFKFAPRKAADVPVLGKIPGFNKVVDFQGKYFEDPLFQHMIPALKMKHATSLAKEFQGQGMSRKEAVAAASKATNEAYGGLNLDRMFRNKNTQNLLRITLLAPDWLESNLKVGAGMAKGLMTGAKGGPDQAYREMAYGVMASYLMANVANKTMSGHWMYENDPGHAFQIDTGQTIESGGKTKRVHLNPYGTALDAIRLPVDTAVSLAKGDTSTAGRIVRNRMAMPAASMGNWLANEDWRNRELGGKDPFGRMVPFGTSVQRHLSNITDPWMPSYMSAGKEMLMEGTAPAEALTGAIEAPVRFSSKPKGKTRKRGGKRGR